MMRYALSQSYFRMAVAAAAMTLAAAVHAAPELPPLPPVPALATASNPAAPPADGLPLPPVELPPAAATPPLPPSPPASVTQAPPLPPAIATPPGGAAPVPGTAPVAPIPAPQTAGAPDQDQAALGTPSDPNRPTQPIAAVEKYYSYGRSNSSLFFLPEQVQRMKEAVRTFEDGGAKPVEPLPQSVAPQPADEPATYPVFHLASIVYERAGAWSLWISGQKITSRRNDTDLTVLAVGRDSATFAWQPSFTDAMNMRYRSKAFASTEPVKNRLTATQIANYDPETGIARFTLRPNQSFAVGYFSTFEGFIESPAMAPMGGPEGGLDDFSRFLGDAGNALDQMIDSPMPGAPQ
jgi:hypothetical protein